MDELKQKIALFIDADNAPASKFEDVLRGSKGSESIEILQAISDKVVIKN